MISNTKDESREVEIEEIINGISGDIHYKINDIPPWYICIFLGFQHYLTMFGSNLALCFIVIPAFCIPENHAARGYIISTTFFVGGIATILQSTIGTRLPIIQGSAFAYMVPVLAILNLPRWKCPSPIEVDFINGSDFKENDEVWLIRVREIQGAIIIASLVETLVGLTGLVGFLLRFISPLTIAPVVCLVTLGLFSEATSAASTNWPIALTTIVLLVLFSQYLAKVSVPIYYCQFRKVSKISMKKVSLPLFQLFPVMLSILISWGICGILTSMDSVEISSPVRTDTKWSMVQESAWFRVPYPFQWGWPTFSAGSILGVLSGVLSSIMESIGDYHACGRLVGFPKIPSHAINRGIMMEGLASVLGGLYGNSGGVTSYSENIATIGITKVASRRAVVYGGVFMILFGMIGKVGNFFMTMPQPVLGGIFCVSFSMVSGVGLSSLQYVNLNSTRNLFILGAALFMGISIPQWVKSSNGHVVETGSDVADQIITVLLSTGLFVASFVGMFLDNTIPGSLEDRGISKWRQRSSSNHEGSDNVEDSCYSFPSLTKWIKKHPFLQLVPISPTFKNK